MSSIFPDALSGGVQIQTTDGTCSIPVGVPNAYCVPEGFTVTCGVWALPDDCTARISVGQINAVASELLCLAATIDPEGTWDCNSLCNLANAFGNFSFDGAIAAICDSDWGEPDDTSGFLYCDAGAINKATLADIAAAICADATAQATLQACLVPSPENIVIDICTDDDVRNALAFCLISGDANNQLVQGADGGLFVQPVPVWVDNDTIVGVGTAGDPLRVDPEGMAAAICGDSDAVNAMAGCLSLSENMEAFAGMVNLLINGDFSINQRGFAGGVLAQYGWDRWFSNNNITNTMITVSGDVITLGYGEIAQIIESPRLAGIAVTISVEDLSGDDLDVDIDGVVGTITQGAGRRGVTLTVPITSIGDVTVGLRCNNISGTASFKRVQLNIGTVALPWERRNISFEWFLCQRYYVFIGSLAGFLRGSSSNNREADIIWPARMRVAPTMTAIASTGTLSIVFSTPTSGEIRSAVGNTTAAVNFTKITADAEL